MSRKIKKAKKEKKKGKRQKELETKTEKLSEEHGISREDAIAYLRYQRRKQQIVRGVEYIGEAKFNEKKYLDLQRKQKEEYERMYHRR